MGPEVTSLLGTSLGLTDVEIPWELLMSKCLSVLHSSSTETWHRFGMHGYHGQEGSTVPI